MEVSDKFDRQPGTRGLLFGGVGSAATHGRGVDSGGRAGRGEQPDVHGAEADVQRGHQGDPGFEQDRSADRGAATDASGDLHAACTEHRQGQRHHQLVRVREVPREPGRAGTGLPPAERAVVRLAGREPDRRDREQAVLLP